MVEIIRADLWQYCMHVSPNYGSLWSACIESELATPSEVTMTQFRVFSIPELE